ncbi:MAG: copper chaperone PCu(A)C [Thiohalocapsa sp.]
MYKTLLAAGLVFGLGTQAALGGDAVIVNDPYARAVPPGQPNSAVFMQLSNAGAADRALVSAASTVSEVVELHTHRMEDGMMKMRRVDQIELPAGEAVTLAPGGLHVMLIGLKQQLAPGDDVPLTLTLDDGSELSLTAPVREVMPMGQMPSDHMHGGH